MNGRRPLAPELREATVAVIRDVAGWPTWAPGVRAVQGVGGALRIAFGGPRPFQCVCRARDVDGGVALDLEQGGPAGLAASLTVADDQLVWSLDLQPGLGLPDVLWRTIEREIVPAALTALVERASRREPAGPPAAVGRSDPAFG